MDALEVIEQVIRWLGGLGALIMLVVVMISVARFRSRPAGEVTGTSPRPLTSPLFLIPILILSVVVCVLLWRSFITGLPAVVRILFLILGSFFYFLGLFFILWGRVVLGRMHNVSSTRGVQLFADHELITRGPFAIVRHPMYLGLWMLILGGLFLYRTWTFVLFALGTPIFVRRARVEEEALSKAFGEKWQVYREHVPAFFPRLGRK